MTINTDYSSLSSTLASLRQEHALQTEQSKEKTQVVQEQAPAVWSRVNMEGRASLKIIIAEQKAQQFFEKSLLEKTDERSALVVKYFLQDQPKDLTVTQFERLEKAWNNVVTVGSASLLTNTNNTMAQATAVASLVQSWSSTFMSQLMNWRNTESAAQSARVRTIVAIAKKAVTEVALPFITVSSIVESVATKLLSIGARVIKRDSTHLQSLHYSAFFTIFWSATTLYHNVKEKTLFANESAACNAELKYIKV